MAEYQEHIFYFGWRSFSFRSLGSTEPKKIMRNMRHSNVEYRDMKSRTKPEQNGYESVEISPLDKVRKLF